MLNQFGLQKIGVFCGFVVPIVAFCCIGLSILSYSEFNWVNNALSDLGVVSGFTGIVFNLGLFVAGLFCFFFAVLGVYSFFKSTVVGKVGVGVFAVAAVWLMGIGVFNESFWPTHFVVAVLFFVTLPVALLILTWALYQRKNVKLAVFTLVSSFVAAAPWVLYLVVRYVPNVAIPEIISSLVISLWIVVISCKILKTVKT
jgi:hypothetical membrane protein